MKLSRKTKIRIRKAVAFARTGFLVLAVISFAFAIGTVDNPKLIFFLISAGIGTVCAAISLLLDQLLFETAWSGDKKSPYIR